MKHLWINKASNYDRNLKKGNMHKTLAIVQYIGLLLYYVIVITGCTEHGDNRTLKPRISLVNSPSDIVTVGAKWLAEEIAKKSGGHIEPILYHSGVLSGGEGIGRNRNVPARQHSDSYYLNCLLIKSYAKSFNCKPAFPFQGY